MKKMEFQEQNPKDVARGCVGLFVLALIFAVLFSLINKLIWGL